MTTLENPDPVERIDGDIKAGFVLLCDHASNALPRAYGRLGLGPDQFDRHIAYDIGARALTCAIAEAFNAPAILSTFSRLLIDPNRGEDDPTLIMEISDGAVVPGNANLSQHERQKRLIRFYRPYHDAVTNLLDQVLATGIAPVILSIHSFTPRWKTTPRPWHAGILWDKDPRLAVPLIKSLAADDRLNIGDNEPYTGELAGDTMNRHATKRGFAHALLEVRQDLVQNEAGIDAWAERLVDALTGILRQPDLYKQAENLKGKCKV